jgi:hypothetical protein
MVNDWKVSHAAHSEVNGGLLVTVDVLTTGETQRWHINRWGAKDPRFDWSETVFENEQATRTYRWLVLGITPPKPKKPFRNPAPLDW